MNYKDCPYSDEIKELERKMEERMIEDVEHNLTLLQLKEMIEKLTKKFDEFEKEMKNGYIPKRAQEWFYSSVGKWLIGLLAGNFLLLLTYLIKFLR